MTTLEQLEQYKKLLDSGAITEEEFNNLKKKALSDFSSEYKDIQKEETLAEIKEQKNTITDTAKVNKVVVKQSHIQRNIASAIAFALVSLLGLLFILQKLPVMHSSIWFADVVSYLLFYIVGGLIFASSLLAKNVNIKALKTATIISILGTALLLLKYVIEAINISNLRVMASVGCGIVFVAEILLLFAVSDKSSKKARKFKYPIIICTAIGTVVWIFSVVQYGVPNFIVLIGAFEGLALLLLGLGLVKNDREDN